MSRVASYARFSSDLQRQTSLEDQLQNCRDYCALQGWTWQNDQVYTDAGISGASIDGRPGLQQLLLAAVQRPRPFDVLLVDDSSRVSRDLADALRIVQRLKFAGVRVIYISQGIDSDSEQHETLIAVHGLVDGLYLREMSAKIKRGLKGQLSRGFATGSRTYGYQTVGVPDPNRHGETIGHRLEVVPDEAKAIRAIYTWYAEGFKVPRIITRLIAEGHPGPRGNVWRVGAIQRILRNPKYTGQLVWGRTQGLRRPGGRFKVLRKLPAEQWQTLDRPDLRIVSDELAAQVRERMRLSDLAINSQRGPNGLLRGGHGLLRATSLFTGFMACGVCGHAVNIVGSHTYKGIKYRYYGCGHSFRNGVSACSNRVTARAELADGALLNGLQAELLHPDTVAYISDALAAALSATTDARPAQRQHLTKARQDAATRLANLVSIIEQGHASATILSAVRAREEELSGLDAQLAALDVPVEPRVAVVPTWVRQQLESAATVVREVPERARTEFQRLGLSFVVHPVYEDGQRPFLRAVGQGDFERLAFRDATPFPAPDALRGRAARARSWWHEPSTS